MDNSEKIIYRNRMKISDVDLDIVLDEKTCKSCLRNIYIQNLNLTELDMGSDGEEGIKSIVGSLEALDYSSDFLNSGKTRVKTKDIRELIDNCTKAVSNASDEVQYVADIIACNKALTGQGDDVDYTKLLITRLLVTEDNVHSTTLSDDIENQYNNMTEEEKKAFLEQYIAFTYVKSKYISSAIIDAHNTPEETQEETQIAITNTSPTRSSRSSSGRTFSTKKVDNPIKENVSKVEPTPVVAAEETKSAKEIINTKSNISKVPATSTSSTKKQTTTTSTVKKPILTTKGNSNTKKDTSVIGGTTKATSLNTLTSNASNIAESVPSSKDIADSVIDKVSFESVSDSVGGTLSSAIDTIQGIGSKSPLKLTKIAHMDMQDNSGNNFIPPIAGLSSAAVAGIGTKMYIAKKEEDKEESESFISNKEQNNINEDKEEQEETNAMSKEDLIRAIEFNRNN